MKLGNYTEGTDEYDFNSDVIYKFKLINPTPQKIETLTTQMKLRLKEGLGQCIYEIGVEENGTATGLSEEDLKISIATLGEIADKLNAKISCFNFSKGKVGTVAEVLIKETSCIRSNQLEIKIGLIGQENSGKSTLVCRKP
jgi:GTPase